MIYIDLFLDIQFFGTNKKIENLWIREKRAWHNLE